MINELWDEQNTEVEVEVDDDYFAGIIDGVKGPQIARPYQLDGAEFLRREIRAMIADPPGLGKTLQAMLAAADGEHIMIICPPYLVEHWWDEITRQFPNDSVVLASGHRTSRNWALEQKAKWLICNYQMLRFNRKLHPREIPTRADLKFDWPNVDTVIFDESHHLRNRDSQQARVAFVLAKDIDRVFLLTGTPIMKEPDDLFMQLRLIEPNTFTSYWSFVNTYCLMTSNGYGVTIHGQRGDRLKRLMDRYALRRTYEEVGLYLPPIIENFVHVNFSPANKKRYNEAKYSFVVDGHYMDNFMQVMHILRMLTGVTEKLEATADLARDLDKFLIFTWYTGHAKWLAKTLDATLIISEEVPPEKRKALVASSDKVVCTLGSLSEGVDASHLRNVIFFEEHYTPGSIYQAVRRVQRWNANLEETKDPINMYFVMVKDTIDEGIHRIQTVRGATIKSIVKEEVQRR